MNTALAAAAASLIGTRFRLHGRDPGTGLDCVGVVAEAMRRAGSEPVVPAGYRLRTVSVHGLLPFAQANRFKAVAPSDADVVLVMVSPIQPHLLVRTAGGFIHAHAGIGRVTFLPDPLPWPPTGGWRVPTPLNSTGD
ncbi:hypothetical protein NSE01_15240 [Novosphingobium sediminis]|uniref:NlpC/P60 domain-containing protein n=1 Tax=Novosphingobium sediminis TaxID=707214 RepID=A0A512AJ26_9SPHN|nr:peptidoglycan endopeptidase [Novosphingobium sediminis]GEN99691.1 hypothetical protein NSE01_15240 [Novosphingobium sediminis]